MLEGKSKRWKRNSSSSKYTINFAIIALHRAASTTYCRHEKNPQPDEHDRDGVFPSIFRNTYLALVLWPHVLPSRTPSYPLVNWYGRVDEDVIFTTYARLLFLIFTRRYLQIFNLSLPVSACRSRHGFNAVTFVSGGPIVEMRKPSRPCHKVST